MVRRFICLALLSLLAASSAGCSPVHCVCCLHDRWLEDYWARHWCGDSCGEVYWSEWFNDPPACCDPCDRCGHFTGHPWLGPHASNHYVDHYQPHLATEGEPDGEFQPQPAPYEGEEPLSATNHRAASRAATRQRHY